MEDTNAMRLGCNLFVMLQVCRDRAEQCHHGPGSSDTRDVNDISHLFFTIFGDLCLFLI